MNEAREYVGDERGEQPVARAMTAPVSRRILVDARSHHHVETVLDEARDHGLRARRVVGGIAVDQHVDVGFHVREHAPHHVAFALAHLAAHGGAGGTGDLGGAVGRIVVIDIDGRVRQGGGKIGDHLGNRNLLVETGHQHRHAGTRMGQQPVHAWRDPLDLGHRFASFAIARSRTYAAWRTCPCTIAILCSRVLATALFQRMILSEKSATFRDHALGDAVLAVIVPFESRSPTSIDRLNDLVAADLERVNAAILSRTGSEVTMIPEVANHLISSGGKRLRPILTLAMAKLANYPGDGHIKLAAAVEFMHTATLLHDDVVDESDMRRGRQAARMLWGNDASVLVGDFLLGQAFKMMVEVASLKALDILSSAAAVIAEGEVMQLGAAKNTATTEDAYLAVIRAKTAELFAAACEVGPVLAARPKDERSACRSFGMNLGIAFQLVDDALDYGGKAAKLGKNVGDDFREGKITLPVVLSFRRGSEGERAFWRRTLEEGEATDADLEQAIGLMTKHRALEDTIQRARHYGAIAQDALALFPASAMKEALEETVEFCINRSN